MLTQIKIPYVCMYVCVCLCVYHFYCCRWLNTRYSFCWSNRATLCYDHVRCYSIESLFLYVVAVSCRLYCCCRGGRCRCRHCRRCRCRHNIYIYIAHCHCGHLQWIIIIEGIRNHSKGEVKKNTNNNNNFMTKLKIARYKEWPFSVFNVHILNTFCINTYRVYTMYPMQHQLK